jgi:hypothetical protein
MSFLNTTHEIPSPDIRERPIWYQVMYNLAAHQAHLAMEPRGRIELPILRRAAPSFYGDALGTAVVLLAASSTTLLELQDEDQSRRWWERRKPHPRGQLHSFLEETMEPASAVLVAGLLDERVGGFEQVGNIPSREQIPQLMLSIRSTEAAPPGLREQLIDYAQNRPRISYRVHYNLACYCSGRSGDGDEETVARALRELARGLNEAPASDRRSLAQWARADPSLKELRRQRDDEFHELLMISVTPALKPRRKMETATGR